MNVLIVDDHDILRDGIALILQQAYLIDEMAFASDGYEAIKAVKSFAPDLVLLDLSMPGGLDGLETLEELRKILPNGKIVILTMYDDIRFQKKAFENGADGFLIKQLNRDALIDSLDKVLASYKVFNNEALEEGTEASSIEELDLPITKREKDVFVLTVRGYTLKDIAEKLDISVKTVENHRRKITQKLDTHKRQDWVAIAKKYKML